MPAPYLPSSFVPISGHFQYPVPETAGTLVFDWDGAAIGPSDEVVLVEEEFSRPVVLHIQGHVARAAVMAEFGEKIRKVVWIVTESNFGEVWRIVETWCAVLRNRSGLTPPLNEYWTHDGICLAMSPRARLATPSTVALSEPRVLPEGGLQ